jgi:hypothetical protein
MTHPFSWSRCAAIALAGALLCWASPSRAQDAEALQRVTDLNKRAVEAYENLDIEEAQKFLQKALEACAAAGLNNHRAKARTHFHLGVVMVGGLKQRDRGIQQFKRALEIDPALTPTKSLVTPEIQSAFDQAKKEMAGGAAVAKEEPKAEPAKEEPKEEKPAVAADGKPPRRVKGIFHEPITEAKPGSTVTIKAAIESGLGTDKVVLAYRPEGASDFLARDMEKDEQGWYAARIPEPATQGNVVSYYIEARNKGGQALAANGSAGEPHVISLAAPQAAAGGGDVTVAKQASDSDSPNGESSSSGGGRKLWFVLGLGGGGGWTKGSPEVNQTNKSGKKLDYSGFAPAQLMHFAPEIGFFSSPDLILSIQGRFQLITGATEVMDTGCSPDMKSVATCTPAKGAVAILGKVTWLLGDPGTFRPWLSLAAGGGAIRHLISIPSLTDCGPDKDLICQDTVLGGMFLIGPAAGVSIKLTNVVSLVAGVNALVGLPYSTVNFDLNGGLAFGL